MKLNTIKKLILLMQFFTAAVVHGQKMHSTHDYRLIDSSKWVIPKTDTLDYAFKRYEGAHALLLKRNFLNYKSASIAYPKDLHFKDGIIESDIASPGGIYGFVGLAFRIKDDHHYETIYFRPGSSGTINAMQYMPEIKSEFNWWDYEDTKYQAKAMIPVATWFHVKIIVKGNTITVYINNEAKPVFVYYPLDPGLDEGSVGFWLGNCAIGAYKNLLIKNF